MEILNVIFNGVKDTIVSAIITLNGASGWLIVSFILAGVLHNVLSPKKFQKHLGNKKLSSILKATISGMFLPICSCGVIPLGISMYYSGAYLGPVLAFMTSTPIINPIAVVLCLGLLGPNITIIYIISGFTIPFIVGILGNTISKDEVSMYTEEEQVEMIELEEEKRTFWEKMKEGLKWSFDDLALTVSKYVILGMLCAGFITTVFPSSIIQKYLGNPGMLSLWSVSVLACVMYVCAVGHIPFIAALIASGAAPGIAITFLIAGAATNLPELISITKVIGKRAVLIYSCTLVISSMIIGYITNLLLAGEQTIVNLNSTGTSIQIANNLMLTIPDWFSYICTVLIILLGIKAILPKLKEGLKLHA